MLITLPYSNENIEVNFIKLDRLDKDEYLEVLSKYSFYFKNLYSDRKDRFFFMKPSEYLLEIQSSPKYYEMIEEITARFGPEKVAHARKEIEYIIFCGVKSAAMKTPVDVQIKSQRCHSRFCKTCSRTRANRRVRYHKEITHYCIVDDEKKAEKIVKDLRKAKKLLGLDYLMFVMTPMVNGFYFIRASNLRYNELYPEFPGEVNKELLSEVEQFFDLYSFLIPVEKTGSDALTSYYRGADGFEFSSLDIYLSKTPGRGAARERGDVAGNEFNYETMTVDHLTEKQIKAREDKKKGIIDSFNCPAVFTDKIPEDVITEVLEETVRESIAIEGVALFHGEQLCDMSEIAVGMSMAFRDKLAERGYIQPEIYHRVDVTQADFDNFMKFAIPNVVLPKNFMEIEITDEDMGLAGNEARPTKSLRLWLKQMTNKKIKAAKDKLVGALPYIELVNHMADIILGRRIKPLIS